MNTTMRAWVVRCDGESGIVVARTPGRAKAIMLASAKYVGIDAQWPSLTVRRAPEFDGLALNHESGPITPTIAQMMVHP